MVASMVAPTVRLKVDASVMRLVGLMTASRVVNWAV